LARQDYRYGTPLILALDTSSKLTSIALSRGDCVIKSIEIEADDRRSEKLWVDIESLLAESSVSIKEISLFGVCVGPGGFTGLRVGMSAIKGLAAATGKPITGVTSLEAAAAQAEPGRVVCALVNAYKSEVYSQLFEIDEHGWLVALNAPLVSTLSLALERICERSNVIFTGNAALESAELIKQTGAQQSGLEPSSEEEEDGWIIKNVNQPLASNIARLSYLKFIRGESENGESLRACYVRPAEAEVKLSLGLLGSKIKRSLKSG
jgi:tRNA threonylcarbamoyladenosine biosynthesis protein TsaB